MIAARPPIGQPMPTAQSVLDRLLEDTRRQREEWQRTSTEIGQVNGVTFGRVRWSGIDPATGARTHGFIYVSAEGRSPIELSAHDVEPHHETALKVAEASALTFRKR
jgi:hypothetical protein